MVFDNPPLLKKTRGGCMGKPVVKLPNQSNLFFWGGRGKRKKGVEGVG